MQVPWKKESVKIRKNLFTFFSDSNGNGNSSGEDRPAADLIDVIGPAPDDNNQNNKMVHMNNHYNDIGNHAIIAAMLQLHSV